MTVAVRLHLRLYAADGHAVGHCDLALFDRPQLHDRLHNVGPGVLRLTLVALDARSRRWECECEEVPTRTGGQLADRLAAFPGGWEWTREGRSS